MALAICRLLGFCADSRITQEPIFCQQGDEGEYFFEKLEQMEVADGLELI